MFCTWFYSTMAHIWKKYTEFIARKNGSLVTVLFGCDSLFVCCVRYGVTEFRWEGHSGVCLQDTFMTPSSVLYLPYIKNWKNKNICLTKLYVIFFINFWCNKYISTLLKKIDIVDESIINVYSMTSYIKWTRVIQLTQRVKTYRGTPNSIKQSIYNHICACLPKEDCVTID